MLKGPKILTGESIISIALTSELSYNCKREFALAEDRWCVLFTAEYECSLFYVTST